MYQVYKISEERLPAAARRTIAAAVKLMLVIYILFLVYLVTYLHGSWKPALLSAAVCIPAYGLALLLGYFLLIRNLRTLRVVLTDEGAEFYMPRNSKKIKWENLSLIKKPNGTTELHDKSISAIIRRLTGDGSIPLIPEIEHYNELLAAISNHSLNA